MFEVRRPALSHREPLTSPPISSPNSTLSSPSVPKGYWIVLATINDPSRFGQYTAAAGPLIASHGGRVLARGEVAVIAEGSVPGRPYLIEFPSYAAAQECFHSAEYQAAIGLRAGVAEFRIAIVEGYTPPAAA